MNHEKHLSICQLFNDSLRVDGGKFLVFPKSEGGEIIHPPAVSVGKMDNLI